MGQAMVAMVEATVVMDMAVTQGTTLTHHLPTMGDTQVTLNLPSIRISLPLCMAARAPCMEARQATGTRECTASQTLTCTQVKVATTLMPRIGTPMANFDLIVIIPILMTPTLNIQHELITNRHIES